MRPEQKGHSSPNPQETGLNRRITINVQTKHVLKEGWTRPKKIRSMSQWEALMLFVHDPKRQVSGRKIKEVIGRPAGDVIWLMRRFFGDVENSTLISTLGPSGKEAISDVLYQFNGELQAVDNPENTGQTVRKERAALHSLYLPDGQAVMFHKNVKQQKDALNIFLYGPHAIPASALAEKLYGKDKKTYRDNAVKIIARLNRQLEPKNWFITQIVQYAEFARGESGVYVLAEIIPDTSPWGRLRRRLFEELPNYCENYSPYTNILHDFWQIRRLTERGEQVNLSSEFELKYSVAIINQLAPALKMITALAHGPFAIR